ncbi:MAG: hypothetical protein K6T66_05850 [Peptococcaceae bacterium]|nr:hypothetical protein [Peptococcaceae bacterium]
MGKNNTAEYVRAAGDKDLLIEKDLQIFFEKNGISKMSVDMVSDIGEHLMEYIRGSAVKLAKILKESGQV